MDTPQTDHAKLEADIFSAYHLLCSGIEKADRDPFGYCGYELKRAKEILYNLIHKETE